MPEDRVSGRRTGSFSSSTSEAVARVFFRSDSNPLTLKRDIRRWLLGVVWSVLLVPLLFYLKFGIVGPLGWGLTVFLSVYCLLSAAGLYFLAHPQYHTPVKLRNDWLDRVGAFWLAACALGPFFGWLLTSAFVLTTGNWRWLYWGRVGLSVVLPVLTALPLLRYVRGQGAPVMLVLLLGVTALPVWSGAATMQDLRSGPSSLVIENATPTGESRLYLHLPHTRKVVQGP
jgi:hypothetical protein